MIRQTGGFSVGATNTRSRLTLRAAIIASAVAMIPSWSPLSPITRTGVTRICSLIFCVCFRGSVAKFLLLFLGNGLARSLHDGRVIYPIIVEYAAGSPSRQRRKATVNRFLVISLQGMRKSCLVYYYL